MPANKPSPDTITLGGGCFWCLDAVYRRVSGVISSTCGYAGGKTKNPTYEEICRGDTGHVEVVQIEFDTSWISLENILEIFWHIHDPTTKNRQGNDIGTQYRSAIYYRNETQKEIALRSKEKTAKDLERPVVTQVLRLDTFYPAEDYHQNYFMLNRMFNPYCMSVIEPKLLKFLQNFPDCIKPEFLNGGTGQTVK